MTNPAELERILKDVAPVEMGNAMDAHAGRVQECLKGACDAIDQVGKKHPGRGR